MRVLDSAEEGGDEPGSEAATELWLTADQVLVTRRPRAVAEVDVRQPPPELARHLHRVAARRRAVGDVQGDVLVAEDHREERLEQIRTALDHIGSNAGAGDIGAGATDSTPDTDDLPAVPEGTDTGML